MRRAGFILVTLLLLPLPASAITGDCNDDGVVDIAELIRGVVIALGTRQLDDCEAFDANGDGTVDIAELIAGVGLALRPTTTTPTPEVPGTATATTTPSATGSIPAATETPTPTLTPSPTVTATGSPVSTSTATETTIVTPATATTTPTLTPLMTASASPTETATDTPTPEVTGSASATSTPTSTGTAVASSTPTATSDATHTPTPTSSLEPSSTATVVGTATETPTRTPSETATSSPTLTATATATPTPAQIAALDFAIAAASGLPCLDAGIAFRLLANVAVDVRDLRIDFCADGAFFDVLDVSCQAVPGTATIDAVEHRVSCDLDQPDPLGQVRVTAHGIGGGALPAGQIFMTCNVFVLPATVSGVYSVQMKLRGTTVDENVFVDFGQSTITVADGLPVGQCCGADSQCASGFCRGGYVPEQNSACCESDCAAGVCNDPFAEPGVCLEQPGAEFRVSTVDYRSQFKPAVAVNDGGFIIAWEGNALNLSDSTDIFARRYDRFGAALGELTVNQVVAGVQKSAAVASLGPGFVVVWSDPSGVTGQRFDEFGERLGTEFQANTYTGGSQNYTSIDSAADGSFVVVWDSAGQDANSQGVFGHRYDSLGDSIGSEFQVHTYTSGTEQVPTVDVAGDGSFIVVWEGVGRGAVGQRFDSLGARVGSEFVAEDLAAGAQAGPFIPGLAILPDGGFVVTGVSLDVGYSSGVFARRFSSSATSLGGSFQVNTFTFDAQKGATVAAGEDGGFVIVWRSSSQDGYNYGIFGQRFGSNGGRIGAEFQVNSYTLSDEREQAIAAGDGGFIVVWQGNGGGSLPAILGQRLP